MFISVIFFLAISSSLSNLIIVNLLSSIVEVKFKTYLIDVNVPTTREATIGIKIIFFFKSSAKLIVSFHDLLI